MPNSNNQNIKSISYELHSFEQACPYKVNIELKILSQSLQLSFTCLGPVHQLVWNPNLIERQHKLWTQTCFELFFRQSGSESYYELNLSPSSAWNIYQLQSYRAELEEVNGPSSEAKVQTIPDGFKLIARVDGLPEYINLETLELYPACIFKEHGMTYHFALEHPQSGPDFHHFAKAR